MSDISHSFQPGIHATEDTSTPPLQPSPEPTDRQTPVPTEQATGVPASTTPEPTESPTPTETATATASAVPTDAPPSRTTEATPTAEPTDAAADTQTGNTAPPPEEPKTSPVTPEPNGNTAIQSGNSANLGETPPDTQQANQGNTGNLGETPPDQSNANSPTYPNPANQGNTGNLGETPPDQSNANSPTIPTTPTTSGESAFEFKPSPAGVSEAQALKEEDLRPHGPLPSPADHEKMIKGSVMDGTIEYGERHWALVENGTDNIQELMDSTGTSGTIDEDLLKEYLQKAENLWSAGELNQETHPDLFKLFHLSNSTESVFQNLQSKETIHSLQNLGVIH